MCAKTCFYRWYWKPSFSVPSCLYGINRPFPFYNLYCHDYNLELLSLNWKPSVAYEKRLSLSTSFDFSVHTNILLPHRTKWQHIEDKARGHQERRGVVLKKYFLNHLIGHCSTVFCVVSHMGPVQNGVIIVQGTKKRIGSLLVHSQVNIFWVEPNYCPKYNLLWEHQFRYIIYNPGIPYSSPRSRPGSVTLEPKYYTLKKNDHPSL